MTCYPLAALVGQEQLRTALLLNAIEPRIGGVLISGEKGTAKSTAARSLAEILPPILTLRNCPYNSPPETPHYGLLEFDQREAETVERSVPFVDLPLGSTEDRVLGSLDFEKAIRQGSRAFHPGLLARANRGILYIDEVNLLPDHLVDLLLDAAGTGINVVQREGMEVIHPARFQLIGTMNPEEGELRPQFLDRFGLMVQVQSPNIPEERVEVLRRRTAFDADPDQFLSHWQAEQDALRRHVVTAQNLLPNVRVSDDLLLAISRLCCEVGVNGLRADLAIHRASRAVAALAGQSEVTIEHVRLAAELALPHRRRRKPFEQPGLDPEQLDQHLPPRKQPPSPDNVSKDENESESHDDSAHSSATPPPRPTPPPPDGNGDSGADEEDSPRQDAREETFSANSPLPTLALELPSVRPADDRSVGRRNTSARRRTGRYVRAIPDQAPTEVALESTIRSAAERGLDEQGRLRVQVGDLHRKERVESGGMLILFIVDASGSMAARRRMEVVKRSVLGLLTDAYQQRDMVAVIAFRGERAELLLHPTRSVDLAERALQVLPTGGRTPLPHALLLGCETIQKLRRNTPGLLVHLVLLTDGKANVAHLGDGVSDGRSNVPSGREVDPWEQTLAAAADLRQQCDAILLLDSEAGFIRLGKGRELAEVLGGEYRGLEGGGPEALDEEIRRRQNLLGNRRSPSQSDG